VTISLPARAKRMIELASSSGWTPSYGGASESGTRQEFTALLHYPINDEWSAECRISFYRRQVDGRWGRWSSRNPTMRGRRIIKDKDGNETVTRTEARFWRQFGDIEFWLSRPASVATWKWLRGVPYWVSSLAIDMNNDGWRKLLEQPFSYRREGRQVWIGRKHGGTSVRLGLVTSVQGGWSAKLYGEDGYKDKLPETFRSKRAASEALKEASIKRGRLRVIHELCADAVTRLGLLAEEEECPAQ